MASTFSCVRTFTLPFLMTAAQNSISFSFEISSLLNLPWIGNSTGLVITSFWRGYLATVPPQLLLLEGHVGQALLHGAK